MARIVEETIRISLITSVKGYHSSPSIRIRGTLNNRSESSTNQTSQLHIPNRFNFIMAAAAEQYVCFKLKFCLFHVPINSIYLSIWIIKNQKGFQKSQEGFIWKAPCVLIIVFSGNQTPDTNWPKDIFRKPNRW